MLFCSMTLLVGTMYKLLMSVVMIHCFIKNNVIIGEFSEASYLYDRTQLITGECSDLLAEFAENAANFTLCSIMNARPIRLCEQCIVNYVHFSQKYDKLLRTNVNGTSCLIHLTQDRLQAVREYHDNILYVWQKGNCNDCFDWNGNSSYPEVSKNTKTFNKKYNITRDCIMKNSDNVTTVCEKCKQYYLELDQFYKSMSKDSIGVESICMDTVDSMNDTRSIWSKKLECCKIRKNPEIIFLCCTGIISFLPVLFYLAIRYCGPIRDLSDVLIQTRFKQKFMRSKSQDNE